MSDDTRADAILTCDEVRDLAASFVLGALDADEVDAVRAHLADCADAHAEIGELGGVLHALAASGPQVEPHPALKARILAAAAADLEARSAAPAAPAVVSAAPAVVSAAWVDGTCSCRASSNRRAPTSSRWPPSWMSRPSRVP